jgi:hypothetical protein
MPFQDNYLILSAAQSVLSTATTASNSPFYLGTQYSGEYGQSPYMSSNLNTVTAQLGQAVKKFFFQVNINSGASSATASTGVTIALTSCLTTAGTYTVVAQTAKMRRPSLTVTVAASNSLLCKIPIPESPFIYPYIQGRYTVGTGVFYKFKVDANLTMY